MSEKELAMHLIEQLPVEKLAYVIGYLCGPSRYAKLSKQQRKAKRVAQKKAQRRSLAEELTRQGAEVHYGERTDVVNKEDKNRLV